MPRYDRGDILMELIELCREIKSEILSELTYYRASVYKTETGEQIELKIQKLKVLADLCGNEELRDAFRDYDVMKKDGWKYVVPGECFLSHRVANLFQAIELHFELMLQDLHARDQADQYTLTKNILKHRREVLAMCRHGSRQWQFFNAI